eukprot:4412960-Alexandrium_andersonii.AAC.1
MQELRVPFGSLRSMIVGTSSSVQASPERDCKSSSSGCRNFEFRSGLSGAGLQDFELRSDLSGSQCRNFES